MSAYKLSGNSTSESAFLSRAADCRGAIDLGGEALSATLRLSEAKRDDFQLRIDRCLKRIERYPESVAPHLVLADLLEGAGLYQQAAKAYEDVLQRNPERHEVLEPLTRIFFKLAANSNGDSYYLQAGFNTAERFLEKCPDKPEAHVAMCSRLALIRDWDKATEHLELAAELDPEQGSNGYSMLGEIQTRLGDHDLAYQSCKKALDLFAQANPEYPYDQDLEIDAGYAALRLDRLGDAHSHFYNGIRLGDKSIETFNRYLLTCHLTGTAPDMHYLPKIDYAAVPPDSEAPIWRMPSYARELCFQAIMGRSELSFDLRSLRDGEICFTPELQCRGRQYDVDLHFREAGLSTLWVTDRKSGNSVEFPIDPRLGSGQTFENTWGAIMHLERGELEKCLEALNDLAPDGPPYRTIHSDFLARLKAEVGAVFPRLAFDNSRISKTGPKLALLGCCEYESGMQTSEIGFVDIAITIDDQHRLSLEVKFEFDAKPYKPDDHLGDLVEVVNHIERSFEIAKRQKTNKPDPGDR